MRKNYLLIAILALLVAACKKDTKEITGSQASQSGGQSSQENISICTGNTWGDFQDFAGQSYAPTLVYNNKVYVFNNPGPGNVAIFDGTNWTTKVSAIPYQSVWVNYAFVIGNKGYLGFSMESTECYEYDFNANTWTQKASFPGPHRYRSAYFSIGNKGYIVAGHRTGTSYSDTWEYNPIANTWTQKASFPFLSFGRSGASGFTIGNKGYVVNGDFYVQGFNQFYLNSMLQYDPATDTWTPKANFPGDARTGCQSFVIGGSAYVGGGLNTVNDFTYFKDFYKYNSSADAWTRIPDLPVLGTFRHSFSINSRGYVTYEFLDNPDNILMGKYTPLTCPIFNPSSIDIKQ